MSTHFDLSTYIYSNLLNSKNVPRQFAAEIANCRGKILLRLLRPNFKGCFMMRKVTLFSFFTLSFFSSFPFNFFKIWAWGCTLSSFPWLSLLFEYFPLWRRFCNFCLTYNLLSWLLRLVSTFTTFFPPFLIIWVHYRGNKAWLMMILLFRIIIWIILWHSRDTFEAFLRYKFSMNTNYKSSIIYFTNKVERGKEDWAPRWDERVKLGKRSIGSSSNFIHKTGIIMRVLHALTWSKNFNSCVHSIPYSIVKQNKKLYAVMWTWPYLKE